MKRFANPFKTSIDAVLDTPHYKSSLDLPSPTINSLHSSSSSSSSSAPSTPTCPTPRRPGVTKHPSWIGPPRPLTPGVDAMKQPVTVEYTHAGLQPPVYVFTSLSDPQWQPVEMDQERSESGEYRFHKSFAAEEGEYQYKFRLGPGDWWVTDESKPVVDDGAGNKNNLLLVKAAAPSKTPAAPGAQPPPAPTPADQPRVTSSRSVPQPKDSHELRNAAAPVPAASSNAPSAPTPSENPRVTSSRSVPQPTNTHESAHTPAAHSLRAQQIPRATADAGRVTKPDSIDSPQAGGPDDVPTLAAAPAMPHEVGHALPKPQRPHDHASPPEPESAHAALLMSHESFSAPAHPTHDEAFQTGPPSVAPLMKHESFSLPPHTSNPNDEAIDSDSDDLDSEDAGPPLLRHESFAPDSAEQTQAPLLRHESMTLGQHHDDDDNNDIALVSPSLASVSSFDSSPSAAAVASDPAAPEPADPNDPTLERFPSDRHGILAHIQRASMGAAEGERERERGRVRDAVKVGIPPPASPGTGSVGRGGSAGSPLASLPSVREDEEEEEEEGEEEVVREREGLRREGMEGVEGDAVLGEGEGGRRPAEPLTPPMTPQEGAEGKGVGLGLEGVGADADGGEVKGREGGGEDEQKAGPVGTAGAWVMHPVAWFTVAGIAMAVAAGWWKLR